MRIIAGRLGGLQFDSPGSFKTHPISDKVRGALFNMLGDIEGLRVLDAFAGSGALAFEAVSRGSAEAVAIDNDRIAQKTLIANVKTLQLGRQVKIIKASASAWLETNPKALFDIVLCDPPYNDLQRSLVVRLSQRVQKHGIFVLSWPGGQDLPDFEGKEKVAHRSYGDAQLAFYR